MRRPHPVTVDRAAGSLLLMAVGNSLGFLMSGEEPDYAAEFARHSLLQLEPPWLEKDGYCFGQYAIDMQLTRELVQSLVEAKGFSPELFAEKVRGVFETQYALDAGESTRRTAQRLIRGGPWDGVAQPPPAAGNGGAIRAVAAGLSFRSRRMRLGVAAMQASITHEDTRVLAAAQVVAEAIFLLASQEREQLALEPLFLYLAELIEDEDAVLADGLRFLVELRGAEPELAAKHLRAFGLREEEGYPESVGILALSTSTVLYALYALQAAEEQSDKVLEIALAQGGDYASLGALSGALMGARLGWDGIDPKLQGWAKHLNDHGEFGPNVLVGLAKSLVQRS